MRRIPLVPTILVLLAVGVMVALGIWQLHRAEWKEALIARAAANLMEPAVDLPAHLPPGLDYRRFRVSCRLLQYDRGPTAGTDRSGMPGWLQKASCLRGPGNDPVTIGLGITERPDRPLAMEAGNAFSGRLLHSGTRSESDYILYAERPLTGLIPVAQPTPAMANTTTPDKHRGYAVQWFLFAATALVIYVIALRRR